MNVMKKKLFVAFTFVAVLSVEGWNLYQEKQNEPSLSEIAAENVDALATKGYLSLERSGRICRL